MQQALDCAWAYQGQTYPNPSVGALITDAQDNIIASGAHQYAGGPHAEVNAIKNAYKILSKDTSIDTITDAKELHEYLSEHHNKLFVDKKIYVTLEPCNHIGKTPACAELICELGFASVIIGTIDPNSIASGGIERLKKSGIHVRVGVRQEQCKKLIEPFVVWRQKPFIFFKLALSCNNAISGGTITSEESRRHMHTLRSKIDLLVIGGNTVRTDRPTLDARLCGGRAPDVLIYSHQKEFDHTIALFSVPNRKVFITDDFTILQKYRFVMIEGGEGMLEACKSFVRWYLFYRSPKIKDAKSIDLDLALNLEFTTSIGEDSMSWFTIDG